MRVATAALLALVAIGASVADAHNGKKTKTPKPTPENPRPDRNTTIPACDQPDGTLISKSNTGKAIAYTKDGLIPIEQSDSPVFYLAPGLGSCGFNYTDTTVGVCLSQGWVASAYHDSCNKWVEVHSPALGTKVQARVVDGCGGDHPETSGFGCNDVYLTLSSFLALAGGDNKTVTAGRLEGPVNWKFIEEPCFACEAGLPGYKPVGREMDTCTGPDSDGVLRNGRKQGSDKLTGAAAGDACNGINNGSNNFKMSSLSFAAKQNGFALNPKLLEAEKDKRDKRPARL